MNENIRFTGYASGIQLPCHSKLSINWKNDNYVTIFWHDVIVIFWRSFVSLVKCSYRSKFHFNIITGSGVITFNFQFSWMSSKSRNRKLEIPQFGFCSISGDWGELGIPDLGKMSLRKCYWMLQNARATAFTVSELLRENQQGVK